MERINQINQLIESIIAECSGICGTEYYHNTSKAQFLEWFGKDIQFNTKESRELGEKLINILK